MHCMWSERNQIDTKTARKKRYLLHFLDVDIRHLGKLGRLAREHLLPDMHKNETSQFCTENDGGVHQRSPILPVYLSKRLCRGVSRNGHFHLVHGNVHHAECEVCKAEEY
jgi:hypothetical protein